MEELTKEVSKSLDRYFNTLATLGYINCKETDKLIILLFINDILDLNLTDSISEEDYKLLNKCLYCLYGTSCLIPYPKYLQDVVLPKDYTIGDFRTTEDCVLRYTEENDIRST